MAERTAPRSAGNDAILFMLLDVADSALTGKVDEGRDGFEPSRFVGRVYMRQ